MRSLIWITATIFVCLTALYAVADPYTPTSTPAPTKTEATPPPAPKAPPAPPAPTMGGAPPPPPPPRPDLDEHMTEDADEEALKGVEAFERAGLSADEHRKAQFGMPVGTTNTYALEGMEDMSPDEYMQAMLDKQMEERRQRRESAGGEVRAPLDSYFAQFNK